MLEIYRRWTKDQWECFDLVKDPHELNNIYNDPTQTALIAQLKDELYPLKKDVKDDDQFANKQPTDGVDGPANPGAKMK